MVKLLFICTHNRCRSILCEAITAHTAGHVIQARSAGSAPADAVHPRTLQCLQARAINTDGLRSQSWDEHEDFVPDAVITVCDRAAGEACPLWFGNSLRIHWGLADPSVVEGSEAEIQAAFDRTATLIETSVRGLAEALAKQAGTIELAQLLDHYRPNDEQQN